jgi:hypothetical protein
MKRFAIYVFVSFASSGLMILALFGICIYVLPHIIYPGAVAVLYVILFRLALAYKFALILSAWIAGVALGSWTTYRINVFAGAGVFAVLLIIADKIYG